MDEPRFVTETRGGWDEWSDQREVLVDIELPDCGRLSPHGDVRVERDGEEFEASLEPVNSLGEVHGSRRCVEVVSWVPVEFESDPLSEEEFREAWGEWLFPTDD